MIVRVKGRLVEKNEHSIVLEVNGLYYEVMVSLSVLNRLEQNTDTTGQVSLITYHYWQIDPSRGVPVLIGFLNELEKDFFLQFITVSGIGPRAALKALNKPISDITRAIDENDINFLKTLPGIGTQRAKEVVAKLQGKIGRFGLIQDKEVMAIARPNSAVWQDEALTVLLQLQYKKQEAIEMIQKALERAKDIQTSEDLLNEIYKQRVKP